MRVVGKRRCDAAAGSSVRDTRREDSERGHAAVGGRGSIQRRPRSFAGRRRSSGRPCRGREGEPRSGTRGRRDIGKRRARACRRRCRAGGLASAGAPASLSRPWRTDSSQAAAGAKSGGGERECAGMAVAPVDRRERLCRRCRGGGSRAWPDAGAGNARTPGGIGGGRRRAAGDAPGVSRRPSPGLGGRSRVSAEAAAGPPGWGPVPRNPLCCELAAEK
jgi:hypothetical protein